MMPVRMLDLFGMLTPEHFRRREIISAGSQISINIYRRSEGGIFASSRAPRIGTCPFLSSVKGLL
jgi:hypothetical protein